MINYYPDCEDYAKNILQRIPVLRTKQLTRALYKLSPYITSLEEARLTLKKVQTRGYLFMSPDGYTVSRGAYSVASNDRHLLNVNPAGREFAIPEIGKLLYEKRLITSATDAFWIACDFLPYSYEFIANLAHPWSLCFTEDSSAKSKVYQITKIKKGEGYQMAEVLKSLPEVPKEARDYIVRIAILEDEREKDIIPHLGFRYFCSIDEKKARGYTVIEKREDKDIWE